MWPSGTRCVSTPKTRVKSCLGEIGTSVLSFQRRFEQLMVAATHFYRTLTHPSTPNAQFDARSRASPTHPPAHIFFMFEATLAGPSSREGTPESSGGRQDFECEPRAEEGRVLVPSLSACRSKSPSKNGWHRQYW